MKEVELEKSRLEEAEVMPQVHYDKANILEDKLSTLKSNLSQVQIKIMALAKISELSDITENVEDLFMDALLTLPTVLKEEKTLISKSEVKETLISVDSVPKLEKFDKEKLKSHYASLSKMQISEIVNELFLNYNQENYVNTLEVEEKRLTAEINEIKSYKTLLESIHQSYEESNESTDIEDKKNLEQISILQQEQESLACRLMNNCIKKLVLEILPQVANQTEVNKEVFENAVLAIPNLLKPEEEKLHSTIQNIPDKKQRLEETAKLKEYLISISDEIKANLIREIITESKNDQYEQKLIKTESELKTKLSNTTTTDTTTEQKQSLESQLRNVQIKSLVFAKIQEQEQPSENLEIQIQNILLRLPSILEQTEFSLKASLLKNQKEKELSILRETHEEITPVTSEAEYLSTKDETTFAIENEVAEDKSTTTVDSVKVQVLCLGSELRLTSFDTVETLPSDKIIESTQYEQASAAIQDVEFENKIKKSGIATALELPIKETVTILDSKDISPEVVNVTEVEQIQDTAKINQIEIISNEIQKEFDMNKLNVMYASFSNTEKEEIVEDLLIQMKESDQTSVATLLENKEKELKEELCKVRAVRILTDQNIQQITVESTNNLPIEDISIKQQKVVELQEKENVLEKNVLKLKIQKLALSKLENIDFSDTSHLKEDVQLEVANILEEQQVKNIATIQEAVQIMEKKVPKEEVKLEKIEKETGEILKQDVHLEVASISEEQQIKSVASVQEPVKVMEEKLAKEEEIKIEKEEKEMTETVKQDIQLETASISEEQKIKNKAKIQETIKIIEGKVPKEEEIKEEKMKKETTDILKENAQLEVANISEEQDKSMAIIQKTTKIIQEKTPKEEEIKIEEEKVTTQILKPNVELETATISEESQVKSMTSVQKPIKIIEEKIPKEKEIKIEKAKEEIAEILKEDIQLEVASTSEEQEVKGMAKTQEAVKIIKDKIIKEEKIETEEIKKEMAEKIETPSISKMKDDQKQQEKRKRETKENLNTFTLLEHNFISQDITTEMVQELDLHDKKEDYANKLNIDDEKTRCEIVTKPQILCLSSQTPLEFETTDTMKDVQLKDLDRASESEEEDYKLNVKIQQTELINVPLVNVLEQTAENERVNFFEPEQINSENINITYENKQIFSAKVVDVNIKEKIQKEQDKQEISKDNEELNKSQKELEENIIPEGQKMAKEKQKLVDERKEKEQSDNTEKEEKLEDKMKEKNLEQKKKTEEKEMKKKSEKEKIKEKKLEKESEVTKITKEEKQTEKNDEDKKAKKEGKEKEVEQKEETKEEKKKKLEQKDKIKEEKENKAEQNEIKKEEKAEQKETTKEKNVEQKEIRTKERAEQKEIKEEKKVEQKEKTREEKQETKEEKVEQKKITKDEKTKQKEIKKEKDEQKEKTKEEKEKKLEQKEKIKEEKEKKAEQKEKMEEEKEKKVEQKEKMKEEKEKTTEQTEIKNEEKAEQKEETKEKKIEPKEITEEEKSEQREIKKEEKIQQKEKTKEEKEEKEETKKEKVEQKKITKDEITEQNEIKKEEKVEQKEKTKEETEKKTKLKEKLKEKEEKKVEQKEKTKEEKEKKVEQKEKIKDEKEKKAKQKEKIEEEKEEKVEQKEKMKEEKEKKTEHKKKVKEEKEKKVEKKGKTKEEKEKIEEGKIEQKEIKKEDKAEEKEIKKEDIEKKVEQKEKMKEEKEQQKIVSAEIIKKQEIEINEQETQKEKKEKVIKKEDETKGKKLKTENKEQETKIHEKAKDKRQSLNISEKEQTYCNTKVKEDKVKKEETGDKEKKDEKTKMKKEIYRGKDEKSIDESEQGEKREKEFVGESVKLIERSKDTLTEKLVIEEQKLPVVKEKKISDLLAEEKLKKLPRRTSHLQDREKNVSDYSKDIKIRKEQVRPISSMSYTTDISHVSKTDYYKYRDVSKQKPADYRSVPESMYISRRKSILPENKYVCYNSTENFLQMRDAVKETHNRIQNLIKSSNEIASSLNAMSSRFYSLQKYEYQPLLTKTEKISSYRDTLYSPYKSAYYYKSRVLDGMDYQDYYKHYFKLPIAYAVYKSNIERSYLYPRRYEITLYYGLLRTQRTIVRGYKYYDYGVSISKIIRREALERLDISAIKFYCSEHCHAHAECLHRNDIAPLVTKGKLVLGRKGFVETCPIVSQKRSTVWKSPDYETYVKDNLTSSITTKERSDFVFAQVKPRQPPIEQRTCIYATHTSIPTLESTEKYQYLPHSSKIQEPAPTFISRPDSLITVAPGQDIIISFKINEDSNTKISLTKRFVDVTKNPRFRSEAFGNMKRFILMNASFDDMGTYCLSIDNNYGSSRSFVTVTVDNNKSNIRNTTYYRLLRNQTLPVIGSTTIPTRSILQNTQIPLLRHRSCSPSPSYNISPPIFYTLPHNIVAECGETVRFQVVVGGFPSPWVTWMKNGIIILSTGKMRIIEKFNTKILEITCVSSEDTGIYTIIIQNEAGRAAATARLDLIQLQKRPYLLRLRN